MNVNLGIWDRLAQLVIGLLVLAVLLGIAFWYLPLIQQNERMRREIHRLETELHKEEDTNRQLKTAIDNLRDPATAPRAVERLAREKLGYAKPGETVIRFQDPPATNSVPQ
jgi:cell division protein FtsB